MVNLLSYANRFAILHRPECPHLSAYRHFDGLYRRKRFGFSDQLLTEDDLGLLQYPQVWVSQGVEVELEEEIHPLLILPLLRLTVIHPTP